VKVPVENLVGARGEGFRIALSILHMGRLKLGANVVGASKKSINDTVKYANERKQFGVLISTFGSIKHKLAEQVIRTFASESATYRVSKDIDELITKKKNECQDKGRATMEAISHYAVEAAILKVYGSETLDYVVDEAVQIHGGMGYSAELPVERGYRDSRINRIFEGTNEINRLLVLDTVMKRAMKGDFDLFGKAATLYENMDAITDDKTTDETYFQEKSRIIHNFKKAILLAIHGASAQYGKTLIQEQEVMNNISDMMIETYISESTLLRVQKLESMNKEMSVFKAILDVNIYEAAHKIRKAAFDAVHSFADPDLACKLKKVMDILTVTGCVNIKDARRKIAEKLIEDNSYKF
jgi:alkylation response protein AidB-like acyl-CoA dehydrogenase